MDSPQSSGHSGVIIIGQLQIRKQKSNRKRMKHLRIIPGRWQRRRSIASRCRLCSANKHQRLIQVLFSTTGGGGPPTRCPSSAEPY
jgi:hypothetical protein